MKYEFTGESKKRSFMANLYEIKEEIWLYENDGEICEDVYIVSEFYKKDKLVMCLVSFGPEYVPSNDDPDAAYNIRDNYGEDVFVFIYDPNLLYYISEEYVNAVFTNLDSQTTKDTIIHSLSNLEVEDLKNLFGKYGVFVDKIAKNIVKNNSKKIGVRSFYNSSSDYLIKKMTEQIERPVSYKVNLLTVFLSNDKNNIDKIEAECELINSFCLNGEIITSFSSDNKLDGLCFTLMSKIFIL
ncbi:hypothetical protein [Treponema sp.]|uniref:hypothetical protein n=1 Tax=Treponema sp. TaxID=166 RepID=UPI0025EB809D|nr:hypothetical protein [Treponema sp.]MBR4322375.1 hypothetical protein [Treponema sp.]